MTPRNDVRLACGRRADVRLSFPRVRYLETIIGVQWGQKTPNRGPTVPEGNEACLVSHCNGGPEGWDFSGTTEHQ